MTSAISSITSSPSDYTYWLTDLKTRIHAAQQRATLAVNRELILLYWQIGREILERQERLGWGTKVIERLADDLRESFPDLKGFSRANLMYMRSFAQAWTNFEIVQQLVGQLPWGHNLVLLTKLKDPEVRTAYARKAIEHNWSRNILSLQIDTQMLERSGKAQTNFVQTLPAHLSDLAIESLKDPYRLDFLGLGKEAQERDIERALVDHVSQFLVELGAGFAYVGRQVHLEVGGEDFYLDLLFYHLKLHCYVVIELKAGAFSPGHLGQLSFYMTAVDRHIKTEIDAPSIGLLLCKTKNKVVAEYALHDNAKPMGIAEYDLIKSLPESLKTSLPSIEDIESRLSALPDL